MPGLTRPLTARPSKAISSTFNLTSITTYSPAATPTGIATSNPSRTTEPTPVGRTESSPSHVTNATTVDSADATPTSRVVRRSEASPSAPNRRRPSHHITSACEPHCAELDSTKPSIPSASTSASATTR